MIIPANRKHDWIMDRISPEPNSGCWLWMGQVDQRGYGRISRRYAHREIYEVLRGPVDDNLELDHLCRVKCCVNPQHLEPVSHRENMLRGVWPIKTHCPHGHVLLGKRKSESGRQVKYCLECARQREASRRLLSVKPV